MNDDNLTIIEETIPTEEITDEDIPVEEITEEQDTLILVQEYSGGETDSVIVNVDKDKKVITATVKPVQFVSRETFPETGSDRLLYISTSDNVVWRWDNNLADYVVVGKDYTVEIADLKTKVENNTKEIETIDQSVSDINSEITDIQAKDIEQDLLLTAMEEANKDRDIKINALETKSAEHEQDLASNEKAIQTNADNISKNASAIEQNSKDIATNTTNIDKNAKAIESNTTRIATLELESGHFIDVGVDPKTFILTISIKNKAGTILSTGTVDLPLETMVVSASYENGTLTLTLQNGQTLDIDISNIVSGLVSEETFNDEVTRLDGEITTLQGEVTAHDLTLTSIEEANKDRDTKINALETKTSEHEQELADYEKRIATNETSITEIKEEQTTQNEQITANKDAITAMGEEWGEMAVNIQESFEALPEEIKHIVNEEVDPSSFVKKSTEVATETLAVTNEIDTTSAEGVIIKSTSGDDTYRPAFLRVGKEFAMSSGGSSPVFQFVVQTDGNVAMQFGKGGLITGEYGEVTRTILEHALLKQVYLGDDGIIIQDLSGNNSKIELNAEQVLANGGKVLTEASGYTQTQIDEKLAEISKVGTTVTVGGEIQSEYEINDTTLAQLKDDETHRLVTDAEKSEWNGNTTSIEALNENKQDKLTDEQVSAVDSGVTAEAVGKISKNESDIATLQTEKASKNEIPRPLWLADSVTLTDAGIEGIYTIERKNIAPLVATGYEIIASDKIMFQTDKALYLGVVQSVAEASVTAKPKFDAGSLEFLLSVINNTTLISNANGGFAAGRDAKTSGVDSIQLGTGTNSTEKSLQIYDDNIYNANTHTLTIPEIFQALTDYGNAFELHFDGTNVGLELGRRDGVIGGPYIDFHTDGLSSTDYNVRIFASGSGLYIMAPDGIKINNKSLLDMIYPVGSIYMNDRDQTSPAEKFGGEWEELPHDKTLWLTEVDPDNPRAGRTISAGLPNIGGYFYCGGNGFASNERNTARIGGAIMSGNNGSVSGESGGGGGNDNRVLFNASMGECGTNTVTSTNFQNVGGIYQNLVYGKSVTVQPPAYRVYAWVRTA